MSGESSSPASAPVTPAPRKSNPLRRVLKWIGITIAGILILIVVALTGVMLWLTPERCTKLFNEYAPQYVDADVRASNVEFSLFSTFPHLRLEIDGLEVISHSLHRLPASTRDSLPSYADSLLSVKSFNGSLNPLRLLTGTISVGDVMVTGLKANLVVASDSTNNFNIFPPSEEKEEKPLEIPRFRIGKVKFAGPAPIRYYNYPLDSEAAVNLSDITLASNPDKKNLYDLNIAGKADFTSEGQSIFHQFPFGFNGKVNLHFDPFRVSLDKYAISLGNLKSEINLSVEVGDDPMISRLQYDIAPSSIMTLLGYLPDSMLPDILNGMESDISLSANIRMISPWKFSSSSLPSFAIDFRVPDSYLLYHLKGEGDYKVDNISLLGTFFFNGTDPSLSTLDVKNLSIAGEGLSLNAGAGVKSLLSDPDFNVNANGHADLTRIMRFIPGLEDLTINGTLNFDTEMKFLLSAISQGKFTDVKVDGSASLRDFLYRDLAMKADISGHQAHIKFGSDVKETRGKRFDKGMLMLSAEIDTVSYTEPGLKAGGSGIEFFGGSTRDMLNMGNIGKPQILPFGMSLKSKTISVNSTTDSVRIHAGNVNASGALRRFEGNSRSPLVDFRLALGRAGYRDRTSRAFIRDFSSNLRLHLNKPTKKKTSRYQKRFDSIAAAHPEISLDSVAKLAKAGRKSVADDNTRISVDLDRGIKRLIRQWNLSGSVKAKGGMISSYIYPARNFFSDLNMDFSLDSIALHNVKLRTQSNSMSLRGFIGNLRQFMLGSRKTPIRVKLNADIDTVNINQMAATYERGLVMAERLRKNGYLPEEEIGEDLKKKSESDTVTVIVPRNIDAAVKIHANECLYTNLNLFDLGTNLYVRNSVFEVDSLHADSDFGKASLNMAYSTRDIDDINMSIDIAFDKINITEFFKKFQTVEKMMPEMTNLRGFVSAKAAASFDVFPNMDIDIPSLRAVLDVRGNDLWVHQSHFIREITKRLLIRNKNDIHINNMVVQASVHDNLLELYPFLFEFDRYKLGFMGENDFNGNMYYHVSVLKSPIPFKFGINVKGTFDKFKIRFGGAKFKSDQAADMINLIETKRINLVKEMRHYLNQFVHKAAISDPGSPGNRLLSSPDAKDDGYESLPGTSPLRTIMKNDTVISDMLRKHALKKK